MVKLGPVIEFILYVQDMNTLASFYLDTLGLAMIYPQEMEDYSDQMWVTFDTGTCTLALHAGGEGRLGQDTPKFVFEVEDVATARVEMLNRGIVMGEIRTAAPGILVCDAKDPEGNRFSIESRSGV